MSFYGAVLGALVRLTCPHCGHVQVRSRRPPHESVKCRDCLKSFAVSDGKPEPARVRDSRR